MNEFIGTIDEEGVAHYPDKTLMGRPVDLNGAIVHYIDGTNNTQFVIFDAHMPKSYDWQARIAELTAPEPQAFVASNKSKKSSAPEESS